MEGLNLCLEQLSFLLNQPWLFSPSFKQLCETVDALAEAFNTHLKQQSNAYSVNQASLTPARTISESMELVPVEVAANAVLSMQIIRQHFPQSLCKIPFLQMILAQRIVTTEKNRFAGLKLVSQSMMYRFMHSNYLGTLVFVWSYFPVLSFHFSYIISCQTAWYIKDSPHRHQLSPEEDSCQSQKLRIEIKVCLSHLAVNS